MPPNIQDKRDRHYEELDRQSAPDLFKERRDTSSSEARRDYDEAIRQYVAQLQTLPDIWSGHDCPEAAMATDLRDAFTVFLVGSLDETEHSPIPEELLASLRTSLESLLERNSTLGLYVAMTLAHQRRSHDTGAARVSDQDSLRDSVSIILAETIVDGFTDNETLFEPIIRRLHDDSSDDRENPVHDPLWNTIRAIASQKAYAASEMDPEPANLQQIQKIEDRILEIHGQSW